jgi:hypothetical protein
MEGRIHSPLRIKVLIIYRLRNHALTGIAVRSSIDTRSIYPEEAGGGADVATRGGERAFDQFLLRLGQIKGQFGKGRSRSCVVCPLRSRCRREDDVVRFDPAFAVNTP